MRLNLVVWMPAYAGMTTYFTPFYISNTQEGDYPEVGDMATVEHMTLEELKDFLRDLKLPADTNLTVTFEDSRATEEALRRQRALKAMKKLRGSGNGRLIETLLKERLRDTMQ